MYNFRSTSIQEMVSFLVLIALFASWPVFFYLIRRRALNSGRGGGWRHGAFFLGPVGALVIFVCLKFYDSARIRQQP